MRAPLALQVEHFRYIGFISRETESGPLLPVALRPKGVVVPFFVIKLNLVTYLLFLGLVSIKFVSR